jgi:hypothetical protein
LINISVSLETVAAFMDTVTVSEALEIYPALIQIQLHLQAMKASNFMFCPKDRESEFL